MQYELINRSHSRRREVEQFICERYWVSFKACLQNLPDILLVVRDENEMVAACGIQLADQRALFSEYYLAEPVESYKVANQSMPARLQIAEVGSMAAISASYLPDLFMAIINALTQLKREVAIFTATRYLHLKLSRLGITLTTLALARESALPISLQDIWGDYYQHQPMVFAGWVAQGKHLIVPSKLNSGVPERVKAIAC
ncbi:MAG: thermostable hemolysin-like protein [Gammaproteobacteria bacterium]|nr:MAG: thermostable hemolysin-like protein [Gammaproteobacteria bacterium]